MIVEEGGRSIGARIDMQISASYQSLLMKSVIRDAVDSQLQIETGGGERVDGGTR